MYLSEIDIKNYGPLDEIKIKPKFNEKGNPLPIVIIGQNGTGKTLFLSNIFHSLVEMKREKYNQIQEVSDNNYFRVKLHSLLLHMVSDIKKLMM